MKKLLLILTLLFLISCSDRTNYDPKTLKYTTVTLVAFNPSYRRTTEIKIYDHEYKLFYWTSIYCSSWNKSETLKVNTTYNVLRLGTPIRYFYKNLDDQIC